MTIFSQFDVARQTFWIVLPEILLLLAGTAIMTAGPFVRLSRDTWYRITIVTLGVAIMALFAIGSVNTDPYSSVALADSFSFYCRLLLSFSGVLLVALAHDQVDDNRAAEFFGSFLFVTAGAMLVAAANELIFLFVGLELVSMPTYLLLYLSRRTTTTQEAATKYFFLSIFSSGLLLFGFAYLYGVAGVTNLKSLSYLSGHVAGLPQGQLALIAVVFVMAGLGFRAAAVPFHFYAPDVYQGSPTVIAAMLSWIPKAIGFIALLRTITAFVSAGDSGNPLGHRAVVLAWFIAVATMTLGNTVALAQENLKRLLAYSSIAHAGYLMIGVAVAFRNGSLTGLYLGSEAILFYLTAYAFMTLGAFGVIILLSTPRRTVEKVEDLAGLGKTHPLAALALTICLFSLAGIPPLAGFWGKFELFASAFSLGSSSDGDWYWWLAVIAVLNSAAGAYYYLKIVVGMYLRPAPAEPLAPRFAWPTTVAVAVCTLLTVIFGLFPAPVARATRLAAESSLERPDPLGQPGSPIADIRNER